MKFLALLLTVPFIHVTAMADKAVNVSFKCSTNPITTNFSAKTVGDEVILSVFHANGVEYAPIHEGIVVPADLSYIKEKADAYKKLGAKFEFHFPLKNCSVYDGNIFNCSGSEEKTIDGVTFTAYSFGTKMVNHRIYDMSVDSVKVSLWLKASTITPVTDMTMEYFREGCEFN